MNGGDVMNESNDMLMAALAAAEADWGDALVSVSVCEARQAAAYDALVEATSKRERALTALQEARDAIAGRLTR